MDERAMTGGHTSPKSFSNPHDQSTISQTTPVNMPPPRNKGFYKAKGFFTENDRQ